MGSWNFTCSYVKFSHVIVKCAFIKITVQSHYNVVLPPSDIRDAAAAAAVGTTPVEMPGFDRWRSLGNSHQTVTYVNDKCEGTLQKHDNFSANSKGC